MFVPNGPFAASGHMVQNPPCWRASYALGHPQQRNCKFVLMKSLCSGCPSGQLALQHGRFCTMWPLAAKGPFNRSCQLLSISSWFEVMKFYENCADYPCLGYYNVTCWLLYNLGLISFPKILADLFSAPETTLNFPYHESSRWKVPLENRRRLRAFRTDNLPKRSVGCPYGDGSARKQHQSVVFKLLWLLTPSGSGSEWSTVLPVRFVTSCTGAIAEYPAHFEGHKSLAREQLFNLDIKWAGYSAAAVLDISITRNILHALIHLEIWRNFAKFVTFAKMIDFHSLPWF